MQLNLNIETKECQKFFDILYDCHSNLFESQSMQFNSIIEYTFEKHFWKILLFNSIYIIPMILVNLWQLTDSKKFQPFMMIFAFFSLFIEFIFVVR